MGAWTETSFHSSVLGRDWAYSYLRTAPANAAPETAGGVSNEKVSPRPSIYLLHGNPGTLDSWRHGFQQLEQLTKQGDLPPLVAVAPLTGTSWWVDGIEAYETAFFRDLLPHVEDRFAVDSRREARIIAGFSMGGFGALRYALTRDHLFGGAILLSPALYEGHPPTGSSARSSGAFGRPFDAVGWEERNYPQALRDHLERKHPVPMLIGAGDAEYTHPDGFEFDVEQQVTRLYGRLAKVGQRPATLRIVPGGHSWTTWAPLFQEGLRYVLQQSAGST